MGERVKIATYRDCGEVWMDTEVVAGDVRVTFGFTPFDDLTAGEAADLGAEAMAVLKEQFLSVRELRTRRASAPAGVIPPRRFV